MRKKGVFFALVMCLLLAATSQGSAGPEPAPGYRELTEKFFQYVAAGKPEEGVQYLFGLNPWMMRKPDDVDKMKSQVANVTSVMGQYQGYELIVEKSVGERLVHLSYFAYYERQPLRFTLQFYKPKDTWTTYGFNFDDTFNMEMMAAANLSVVMEKKEK